MSIAIKIEIDESPTPTIIHRFRNSGEDVYRALMETCLVSIEEIDNAKTDFTVRNIRKRDLGTVTQIIKDELKKHNFTKSARLIRQ